MTSKPNGNQYESPVTGLIHDIDNRDEQHFVRVYHFKSEMNTLAEAQFIKKSLLERERIIDFLNEVEEQDWELDADDIKHILNDDFDYIRKQYQVVPQ